jgi:hypothetical protein
LFAGDAMSDPIKGSWNVTLPAVSISRPTEAWGYLVAARGMLEGALPLGQIKPLPSFALTLLCGHACEAALKAALAQSGISPKKLRSRYGHSILKLWEAVANTGVPLPAPLPGWVAQLNRVYDKPFHLRYPLGFHGIVLPDQCAMLRGTESLVKMVTPLVK